MKAFKTIDEQLDILESRNLKIQSRETAYNFLLENNYYRVSGYTLTLRKNDVFYDGVTFENIIDIYNFDKELRSLLLHYLQIVEVRAKAIYAYEFSNIHNPYLYTDSRIFSDTAKYLKIMEKAEKQKARNLPNEPFLKHHDAKQEPLPIWAYVELFTISDLSILYSISDQSLAEEVAKKLGIKVNGVEIVSKHLHRLTILRNLCAHGSRIYNRIFQQKPYLSTNEKKFLRKNAHNTIDNSRLYGFMFILKRMLLPTDFSDLKSDLIELTIKYPFIDMGYYGFSNTWKSDL